MAEIHISRSREETEKIGEALAPLLGERRVVALFGALGAGKTALVTGLAHALGYRGRVSSPTYTIVNEYPAAVRVCHFDLYRIGSFEELLEIGWEDYLREGAYLAIEWSERIAGHLPQERVEVRIDVVDEHTRRIAVCRPGEGVC